MTVRLRAGQGSAAGIPRCISICGYLCALALLLVAPLDSPLAGAMEPAQAADEAGDALPSDRPEGEALSPAGLRVADWVSATADNAAMPYIIIDKEAARLFLFDAEGKALGDTPVLIGVARGDDATPGIGNKDLSRIGPAERTTPAGRFMARYGWAAGGKSVLWVDYATSVALHPLVPGTKQERRRARLLSSRPSDNRITFGCINVGPNFYASKIRPLFKGKGGMVYILPDTRPIEDIFPRLRAHPFPAASR
jgi:hypothetical protein